MSFIVNHFAETIVMNWLLFLILMGGSCIIIIGYTIFLSPCLDFSGFSKISARLFYYEKIQKWTIVNPWKAYESLFNTTLVQLFCYLLTFITLWQQHVALKHGTQCLSDCNRSQTHNHIVRKQTLNHLGKLV